MSAHHTFELTFFSTFFELFPIFARGMTAFICFLYQSQLMLVKSLFLLVESLLLLVKSPFLLVESLFLLVKSPFFTTVYDSRSASRSVASSRRRGRSLLSSAFLQHLPDVATIFWCTLESSRLWK